MIDSEILLTLILGFAIGLTVQQTDWTPLPEKQERTVDVEFEKQRPWRKPEHWIDHYD